MAVSFDGGRVKVDRAMTVDEYVNTKVLLELRETVAMLRATVRDVAPQAEELISYGMPVFKARKLFAWISPGPKDLVFGFSRGAQFEDRFNLLRGAGKGSKHIRIKSPDSVDGDVLRYYIGQALERDAT
jgi:uncharacterized protein YdhG (YjbR/CyaY superfamily)